MSETPPITTDRQTDGVFIPAEGEQRVFTQRKTFTVVENGSWHKGLWQLSIERAKGIVAIVALLTAVGGVLTWMFREKVDTTVREAVRDEIKPYVQAVQTLDAEFDQHILDGLKMQHQYVRKDELKEDLESLEYEVRKLREALDKR